MVYFNTLVRALVMGALAMLPAIAGSTNIVLNEYNAVKSGEYLKNGGADGRFGRIDGNGGDWLELVVVIDHSDIRGWTMHWSDSDPNSGTLTFSEADVWADLRAGTIITIAEDYEIRDEWDRVVVSGSDLSTDFIYGGGDWWIHVVTENDDGDADPSLVSTDNNGSFSVNNDNWQLSIHDADGTWVFGPIGEAVSGWTGGGVGKDEIGELETNPHVGVTNADYDDGSSSTFGAANQWDGGLDEQDFSGLRSWAGTFIPVPTMSRGGFVLLVLLVMAAGVKVLTRSSP